MIFYLSVFLMLLPGCFLFKGNPGKEVVLKVNSCTLTAKDFAEQLTQRLQSHALADLKNQTTIDQTKKSIERDFIFDCLVREYADKEKLSINDEMVQQEVRKIEVQYPDHPSFLLALKEQGISLNDYKKRIERTLLQKALAEDLSKDLTDPSNEQVEAYFETNRREFTRTESIKIRQILVETEPEAQRILKDLRANKNFRELAEQFSLAPEGPQGGEIGWVYHGTADIFEPIFKVKVGQRSNPIKSPYGYHIVEVLAKRPEGKQSLGEVREKIIWTLRENQRHARFSVWLEQQIKAAKILKDQNFIDQLKVETKGS